jgi:uncharacterized protein YciI
MAGNLEIEYGPFMASLLSGGFAEPESGDWPAEFVAAHVAINNDLIADAAEALVRGEDVLYDNAPSVDEDELSRYVERVGDVVALAEEIKRSAGRLDNAYESLGELAGATIHVRIRDGKDIAYEGSMLIGTFMEGNATRHLGSHHDQLKALHGPWVAEPPQEFDTYQLIVLSPVPDRPELTESDREFIQRQHLGHFAKMRNSGYLVVSGPIDGDDVIAGICIYRARSVAEARILAEDDPAVRAGRFEVSAMSWYTARDALVHR